MKGLMWEFCRNAQFPQSFWRFSRNSAKLCVSTKFSHQEIGEIVIFLAAQFEVIWKRYKLVVTQANYCFFSHSVKT